MCKKKRKNRNNIASSLSILGIPLTQLNHVNDKTDTGTLAGKYLIITGTDEVYNFCIIFIRFTNMIAFWFMNSKENYKEFISDERLV